MAPGHPPAGASSGKLVRIRVGEMWFIIGLINNQIAFGNSGDPSVGMNHVLDLSPIKSLYKKFYMQEK